MRTMILCAGLLLGSLARAAEPCDELSQSVDLSRSPTDDRRVFCTFARDLIVGSCCQSSLYDCLEKNPTCARARALALVGLSNITGGGTEESALAAATHYRDSLAWDARQKVALEGAQCKGGKGPKSPTLVEFSDFDCPHCAVAQKMVEKLLASRPEVRLCVLQFSIHAHSLLAAAAALEAARAGRYWQMAKALFASQEEREALAEGPYVAQLADVAKEVGVDPLAVRKAALGGPALELAKAQRAEAERLKLDGTPSFFLDGHPLEVVSLPFFQAAVDDELAYEKQKPRQ
ncbi:MAG: DsbA family protein [Deltaproteobacteria bacterium]